MSYVSEAGWTQVSNVGRDVTLLIASCVTAVGVVSLVCLHYLSRRVAYRRTYAVYTCNITLLHYYIVILLYYIIYCNVVLLHCYFKPDESDRSRNTDV